MTVVRCDIFGTPDVIQQGTGSSAFSQRYIHDLAKLPGTHNDGMQLYGGPGVVITDNCIELSGYHGTEYSAVFHSDDGEGFASPQVVGNHLSGGGYQLRLEAGVAGAVVTANDVGPLAGGWGEVLVSPGSSVAVWAGNVSASGAALPAS